MRARMKLTKIIQYETFEELTFSAVSRSNGYPEDGSDEDNTFAKWTPSATFTMAITNPALVGTFKVGQTYYVDFTLI